VFGDDRAGGDDGTGPNAAVVEDPRANADKAFVLNHAAVYRGVMADGNPVSHDDRIEVPLAVENGAVLDVGVGADANGIDVTAEDGIHPDGGVGAEGDVPNELCGQIDVAGIVKPGLVSLVIPDHG